MKSNSLSRSRSPSGKQSVLVVQQQQHRESGVSQFGVEQQQQLQQLQQQIQQQQQQDEKKGILYMNRAAINQKEEVRQSEIDLQKKFEATGMIRSSLE